MNRNFKLYDFVAKLYNENTGGFWGVDLNADRQFALTPYHFGANNLLNILKSRDVWWGNIMKWEMSLGAIAR